MDKLSKYFRDTLLELKQVSWPTTRQALLYTALVVVISFVVSLFTGGFDYLFSQVVKATINSF